MIMIYIEDELVYSVRNQRAYKKGKKDEQV